MLLGDLAGRRGLHGDGLEVTELTGHHDIDPAVLVLIGEDVAVGRSGLDRGRRALTVPVVRQAGSAGRSRLNVYARQRDAACRGAPTHGKWVNNPRDFAGVRLTMRDARTIREQNSSRFGRETPTRAAGRPTDQVFLAAEVIYLRWDSRVPRTRRPCEIDKSPINTKKAAAIKSRQLFPFCPQFVPIN